MTSLVKLTARMQRNWTVWPNNNNNKKGKEIKQTSSLNKWLPSVCVQEADRSERTAKKKQLFNRSRDGNGNLTLPPPKKTDWKQNNTHAMILPFANFPPYRLLHSQPQNDNQKATLIDVRLNGWHRSTVDGRDGSFTALPECWGSVWRCGDSFSPTCVCLYVCHWSVPSRYGREVKNHKSIEVSLLFAQRERVEINLPFKANPFLHFCVFVCVWCYLQHWEQSKSPFDIKYVSQGTRSTLPCREIKSFLPPKYDPSWQSFLSEFSLPRFYRRGNFSSSCVLLEAMFGKLYLKSAIQPTHTHTHTNNRHRSACKMSCQNSTLAQRHRMVPKWGGMPLPRM